MSRFTSLPAVLFDSEGRPLRPVDEVALVIGLVAGTLQQEQSSKATVQRQRTLRLLMLSILALFIVAGLLLWWLEQQGQRQLLLPAALVAGALLLLLVGRYTLLSRPSPAKSGAAVTRVGRAYWPVGILPLDDQSSLLWDPEVADAAPLERMALTEALGADSAQALHESQRLRDAFDALLGFDQAVASIEPKAVAWPSSQPDESVQRVGEESHTLWSLLEPVQADTLAVALPASNGATWDELADAAASLSDFHRARQDHEQAFQTIHHRAEGVAESAREILIDRHWRVVNDMGQERQALFAESLEGGPPTHPGGALPLGASSATSSLTASLDALDSALLPFYQSSEATRKRLLDDEAAASSAAAERYAAERSALDDTKRKLTLIDSDILQIGERLESEQQRIHDFAAQSAESFNQLAQLPLAEVHGQLRALEDQVRAASGILSGVSEQLDLESLASATDMLGVATQQAHDAWSTLAKEMPERSASVQQRTERMLTELSAIPKVEGTASVTMLRNLESSAREVERVTRAVVSWAAAQQDPVDVIEDKHRELEAHVKALRTQRGELDEAQSRLATLNDPANEAAGELPAAIEQAARVLRTYQTLTDQVRTTVRGMDNAAELVKLQSEELQKLLRERNRLREAYESGLDSIAQREQAEQETRTAQLADRLRGIDEAMAPISVFQAASRERVARFGALPGLAELGRISPDNDGEWPERVANDLGLGIEAWGKQIAGVEAPPDSSNRLNELRRALDERHQALQRHAVKTELPADAAPTIAFIPFWLVESVAGGDAERHRFHLLPPAQLAPRRPTDAAEISSWLFPEISRRLAGHISPTATDQQAGIVTFTPDEMSAAARHLDMAPAQVPPAELATALAQHWLFFRSEDRGLNEILLNSRNRLIPEQDILAAFDRQLPTSEPARLSTERPAGGAVVVERRDA